MNILIVWHGGFMRLLLLTLCLCGCSSTRLPSSPQERANYCANLERNTAYQLKHAEDDIEVTAIQLQSAEYSEEGGCDSLH